MKHYLSWIATFIIGKKYVYEITFDTFQDAIVAFLELNLKVYLSRRRNHFKILTFDLHLLELVFELK